VVQQTDALKSFCISTNYFISDLVKLMVFNGKPNNIITVCFAVYYPLVVNVFT